MMIRMLGAPLGGRSCSIGGYFVSGSLASYVMRPVRGRSGIGRWNRDLLPSLLMGHSFPLAGRGRRPEEHPFHLAGADGVHELAHRAVHEQQHEQPELDDHEVWPHD